MTAEEIHNHILASHPDSILKFEAEAAQPWVEVKPEALINVLRSLCSDSGTAFDCLDCLSGVDYPDDEALEVVYHLYSYRHLHDFVVKVRTTRSAPEVPSVTGIWPAGDWYERETYDLFGIRFTGHPEMTRLFLPDDWPGHPFLKDWKEPEFIWGIPTTRPNPLEKNTGGADEEGGGAGGTAAPAKKKKKKVELTPEKIEELKKIAAAKKAAKKKKEAEEAAATKGGGDAGNAEEPPPATDGEKPPEKDSE